MSATVFLISLAAGILCIAGGAIIISRYDKTPKFPPPPPGYFKTGDQCPTCGAPKP